ncbi:MAG: class I SAM-dependent methyltransferase [bacterium]
MSDILMQVQAMYDEAGVYFSKTRSKKYGTKGSQNWPVTQKYLDKVKSGQSVLDIGCGNGKLVSGLAKGAEYLGIDFSKTLLQEAKTNFPNYDFRYGNVVEPKAWKNLKKYDAIFCVAVLHHLPEKEQQVLVLKKMRSLLKNNGFIYLSVWNLWQKRFLQYHLDSLELKKENPRWVNIPFDTKWERFCVQMDIPYIVELMEEAGLDLETIFYAGKDGKRADVLTGQNLVAVARLKSK